MKKRKIILAGILVFTMFLSGACGGQQKTGSEKKSPSTFEQENQLEDGIYTAVFETDSSMFRVNESKDGKGILTVSDGKMTIHVSLASKNIIHLYPGPAADAQKEGADLLEPTVDTVTYADGWTEEVYGFDIPVTALDEEFDVALIGKKGKWYDHKVTVSDPQKMENSGTLPNGSAVMSDGVYEIGLEFEGGSGRASVQSPATLYVADQQMKARIQWSSPNYDYMIVDGERYDPINTVGDSVFEIPVKGLDIPITVIGDTVAMSRPHEVEYTITFLGNTCKNIG